MDFRWHMIKEPLADAMGLSHPILHVLIGTIAFFAGALLLRKYKSGLVYSWLFVLAIELLNEVGDAYDWIQWTGNININNSIEDILLTMVVPTISLILGFYFPKSRSK